MCRVVVLPIKPVALLPFSLPAVAFLFANDPFCLKKHFVKAISEFQKLSLLKDKGQNLSYENELYLHENKNSFSYQ